VYWLGFVDYHVGVEILKIYGQIMILEAYMSAATKNNYLLYHIV